MNATLEKKPRAKKARKPKRKIPRTIHISAVKFIRKANGKIEDGIIINDDILIIDMFGKPVPSPVWNYWRHPYYLSVLYDRRQGT